MQKKIIELPQNLTVADIQGNNGGYRYCFITSLDHQAETLALQFENVKIKKHLCGNFFSGKLNLNTHSIDVAAIAVGIGKSSLEMVLKLLLDLGATRILLVNNGISLQPEIDIHHFINIKAAIRAKQDNFPLPAEFPCLAALEFTSSILLAAEASNHSEKVHTGLVYSGEYIKNNLNISFDTQYEELLQNFGVLACEKQCDRFYMLTQLYNQQLKSRMKTYEDTVLAGAIIETVEPKDLYAPLSMQLIELACSAISILAGQEAHQPSYDESSLV